MAVRISPEGVLSRAGGSGSRTSGTAIAGELSRDTDEADGAGELSRTAAGTTIDGELSSDADGTVIDGDLSRSAAGTVIDGELSTIGGADGTVIEGVAARSRTIGDGGGVACGLRGGATRRSESASGGSSATISTGVDSLATGRGASTGGAVGGGRRSSIGAPLSSTAKNVAVSS